MLRTAVVLSASLILFGCASQERIAAGLEVARARKEARLAAVKIPDAQLNSAQMSALAAEHPTAKIVWHRAGVLEDGKIFVCYVTSQTSWTGKTGAAVYTVIFEADNSFRTSWGVMGPIQNCQSKGFDPPVTWVLR